MSTDWTVAVVSPVTYNHSATFNDMALALQGAFIDLGYSCNVTSNMSEISGRSLILGANLLPYYKIAIPDDAIIYNTEIAGKVWMTDDYLAILRKHLVWDYSQANVDWLATQGVKAKLCRIGYHPSLEWGASTEHDIDVLFYGSNTDRRTPIIKRMWDDGIKIYGMFGVYGPERDACIARAKIVLNLHAWDETAPLEMVRLQLLFANAKCVLTETCPHTDVEWQTYRGCMAEAKPAGMAEVARHLLENPALRSQLGQIGYDAFRANPQTRFVVEALGLADNTAPAPRAVFEAGRTTPPCDP